MGWFKGEELISSDLSYTFAMPAVDTTFTAKWIKVTLSRNDTSAGTISSLSGRYVVGQEVTITASTRNGYTFIGWYEGDKLLTNELSYTFKMPSTETTFTAQWIDCPVTLEQSIEYAGYVYGLEGPTRVGEEVTVTAETYSGYTWIGWYDGETELTKELSYTFVMSADEKILTAKWECYTITTAVGEVRGGSISTMSNVRKTAGEIVTIEATTYNGYMWMGWYNGETLVSLQQEYTFAMPSESIVYTATWMKCPVTLAKNIEEAGNVSGMGNTTTVGEEITITSATNEGYTWLGWYNGEILLTQDVSYTFTMPAESITYTACWAAYTLTTAVNNAVAGTVTEYENYKITAGEEVTVEANTNNGYTFTGWYNEDTLLTENEVYVFVMPSESVTYTAKWTAYTLTVSGTEGGSISTNEQKYLVSFDLNGVEGTAPKLQIVTASAGIVYPEVPMSSGYVFVGWYKDKEGTEKYDFSADITSDLILYAKWYKTSAGGHSTTTIDVISDNNSSSDYYIASNANTSSAEANYVYFSTLTSGNYSFHYRTEFSNSTYGTYFYVYNVTQNRTILSNVLRYSTSYATVSFTAKEGDVISVRAYKYSSSSSVSSSYMFYIKGAESPVAGGVATYSPVAYNVTEGNDVTLSYGKGTVETVLVTATQPLKYPAIKNNRSGYVFRGWYTDVNCTKLFDFSADITDDVVLYAGWHEISTEGYTTNVINIASGYNTSSSSYKVTDSYSSAASANYVYFTALSGGSYSFYYVTSASSTLNSAYFYVYNATQGKAIMENTLANSTSFYSKSFTADAGDVIYVRIYRYSTSYTSNYSFYVKGDSIPADGGVFNGVNKDVNTDGTGVVAGEQITISAKSDYGYVWLGWYNGEELVSTDLTYTFNMPSESVVYTAKWTYYSVTTQQNIAEAGDITQKDDQPVAVGDEVTLTATSNYGYIWLGWYDGEELISTDMTYSFVMQAESVVYTARWTYYSVTTQQNNELAGSITLKDDEPVNVGDSVIITASTNDGYTWSGWYDGENLLTSDLSYQFVMPEENVVYTAKWIECPVTLEKNMEAAGNVTGNEKTVLGKETTITAITNDGYTFLGWYCNEELVTNALTYTVVVTEEPVTYTAMWMECPVTLEKNIAAAGTVSGTEKTLINTETTITAVTNEGYIWLGWYEGDELITEEDTYTFLLTETTVTYTAKWEYAQITLHYIVNGQEANSEVYRLDEPINSLWVYGGDNFSGWHLERNFSTNSAVVTSTEILKITENNAYLYGGTYLGTQGLEFLYVDNSYELVGYSGAMTEVTVASSFNGLPVTAVAQSAFMNHSELTEVSIPASVTVIAGGAFSGCSSLQSITVPFVGGSKATVASESTLFGYIFGENEYDGGIATRQDYTGNKIVTYYIPETLTKVTIGRRYIKGGFPELYIY